MSTCVMTADLDRYMREVDEAESRAAAIEDMAETITDEIIADPGLVLEAITESEDSAKFGKLLAQLVDPATKVVEVGRLAYRLRDVVLQAIKAEAETQAPDALDKEIGAAAFDRWEVRHG